MTQTAEERDHNRSGRREAARLEYFSDCIFAISITLLILNVSLPAAGANLTEVVRKVLPEVLGYALTFFMIGVLWTQHHAMFALIRRTDQVFLLINILYLMCIAFLPFPARVLGANAGGIGQTAAAALYAGTFLVAALVFNGLWKYASCGGRLLHSGADRSAVHTMSRSHDLATVLYLVDVALAFVTPAGSIIMFTLIAVFYAVTPIPSVARSRLLRPLLGPPPKADTE
jgi:uncharacterized membrane protein